MEIVEKGGGAIPSSTMPSARNTTFLSPIVSLGISLSGIVGADVLGTAPLAFAGAKSTRAGLWYDNRRVLGREANVSCRLVLFAACTLGGLFPDA
jgi:predicted alpha/beta superfamily hydrolase